MSADVISTELELNNLKNGVSLELHVPANGNDKNLNGNAHENGNARENGNGNSPAIIDSTELKSKNPIEMGKNEPRGDGADERMLGGGKKEEVKFITGDQQNGDAKIDIGDVNQKTFTGMTKEELMKYANDPFWVRLRWIFFILFWLLWLAMLVGAVMIIIQAPKCAAPKPLIWYKQGPLVQSAEPLDDFNENQVDIAKKFHAKGVIYKLPDTDTYLLESNSEVTERLSKIISAYKAEDINVIIDLTVNYATKESPLFQNALKDDKKQSAFIWVEGPNLPNNWLSIKNGSAWANMPNQRFVLSQFGDEKYDLKMNSTIVKAELKSLFKHLIKLGIKGFRLANTKNFIIKPNLKEQDKPDYSKVGSYLNKYDFWTHHQTMFPPGLGDLLEEYKLMVRNISNDEAYLSVSDDIIRPDNYLTESGTFGIDLPIYGRFTHDLATGHQSDKLYTYLENNLSLLGGLNATWLQWVYDLYDNIENGGQHIHPSAYNMFLMLLPGVPILPNSLKGMKNITHTSLVHCEHLRMTPSFMHGSFNLSSSGKLIAYSRIKSGNPGYFVVINPSDELLIGNFSSPVLPEKMTVDMLSDNYNVTDVGVKSKVTTTAIKLSPFSAIILTYVPVKK